MIVDFFRDPLLQFIVFSSMVVSVTIVSRLDEETIVSWGFPWVFVWMIFVPFWGISSNVSWWFYPQLLLAIWGASFLCFGCMWLAERFGRSMSMGEGAIVMMMPFITFPIFLGISAVLKLIWTLLVNAFS